MKGRRFIERLYDGAAFAAVLMAFLNLVVFGVWLAGTLEGAEDMEFFHTFFRIAVCVEVSSFVLVAFLMRRSIFTYVSWIGEESDIPRYRVALIFGTASAIVGAFYFLPFNEMPLIPELLILVGLSVVLSGVCDKEGI